MHRQFNALFAILLLIAIFIGVNFISNNSLRSGRLDLTDGKLYTISQGSRNICRSLQEPVTLTLYFSAKAAQGAEPYASYGQRVKELLQEFRDQSAGKIIVRVVDPRPDSEEETKANSIGLQPIRAARDPIFLGILATNSVDGQEILPVLDPAEERLLEYQISKLIYTLSATKKRVVGLVTPLPINQAYRMNPQTGQPEPRKVAQALVELRSVFEVRDLGLDLAEVPKDVDVLMVVHPKELSDKTLFAIDQFVMGGGRLLAFVDPHCESDIPTNARNQMEAMLAKRESSLNKILNAWGVEIPEGKVVGDALRAVTVAAGQNREPVRNIVWMDMQVDRDKPSDTNLSSSDIITGGLSRILFASPGAIQERPNRGDGQWATITPLIQTTDQSAFVDAEKIRINPDPKKLLAEFIPSGKKITIAARLTGKVKSAFPSGKPAEPPKDPSKPDAKKEETKSDAPLLAESKDSINVVLIADADFIDDRFWVREERLFGQIPMMSKFRQNGDFISNAVDNLSGSTDLISIRARGDSERPFTRVQAMLADAETKYRVEEDALEQQVQKTRSKIEEIQRTRADQKDSSIILTPEQQAEIAKLRTEAAETDKKLRQVRFNLRKDVEDLGLKLKLVNIALMPAVVVLIASVIAFFRFSRRRQRTAE